MINHIKHLAKYLLKDEYRSEITNLLKMSGYKSNAPVECDKDNILVIQRLTQEVGTFSDYIVFLHYIERAVEKGWTPIIDRKTVKNIFLPAAEETNTWELFFEQPCGLSLEDISQSGMNSYTCYTSDMCSVSLLKCKNPETISYWRKMASKYVRFNKETERYVSLQKDKLLAGKRVIGVSIREGYTKLAEMDSKYGMGHALQTPNEQIISDVKLYMERWDCPYVFFTCQTTDTVDDFKLAFGDKALYHDRERPSYKDLREGEQLKEKTDTDRTKNELDYITEMYLLSRCTSLICSENSGSEAAFLMSEGFEHFHCYDSGLRI